MLAKIQSGLIGGDLNISECIILNIN